MKNIDDFMNNLDLSQLDNIELTSYELNDIELKHLHLKTLKKAGITKKKNKRFHVKPLLIAATLYIAGATLVTATNWEGINYFTSILKERDEQGKIVDLNNQTPLVAPATQVIKSSTNQEGLELTVDAILGDKNAFYILLNLKTKDGSPLEGNYRFGRSSLHFPNLQNGLGYSVTQLSDDSSTDNQITFLLSGSSEKSIINQEVSLAFIDLLKEVHLPEIHSELKLDQVYKEITDHTLTNQDLNLSISETLPEVTLDSMSLTEDSLQLLINHNFTTSPYFCLKNKVTGTVIKPEISEEDYTMSYYYTFDSITSNDLSSYELFMEETVNEELYKHGEWPLTFTVDYLNTATDYHVNKKINLSDDVLKIKSLSLSPISITLDCRRLLNDPIATFDIGTDILLVQLKDGTTLSNFSQMGSSSRLNKVRVTALFDQVIDISEIESIQVGDLKIPIN